MIEAATQAWASGVSEAHSDPHVPRRPRDEHVGDLEVRPERYKALEPGADAVGIVEVGREGVAARKHETGVWGEHFQGACGVASIELTKAAADNEAYEPSVHTGHDNISA